MAWCRSGNKPLSETMMVRLPRHIWASMSQCSQRFRPQGQGQDQVNTLKPEAVQNGQHFEDVFSDAFFMIFFLILPQISLKFLQRDPFDNKSAWVQVTMPVCHQVIDDLVHCYKYASPSAVGSKPKSCYYAYVWIPSFFLHWYQYRKSNLISILFSCGWRHMSFKVSRVIGHLTVFPSL